MRSMIVVVLSVTLMACAGGPSKSSNSSANNQDNPYESTFKASQASNAPRHPDPNGPKIYRGVDKDKDYIRMEERGFEIVGYSSFTAGNITPNLMIPQAKKVKADVVMVYTERTGQVNESIQELKIEQSKRNAGIKTDDLHDRSMYTYFAAYWAKLAPPVLGVHVKPSLDDNSPKGLLVVRVLDDSPADAVGIQEDDILQSIGDVTLLKVDNLGQATQRYAGQSVDIVYFRDGKSVKTRIKLNKRLSS